MTTLNHNYNCVVPTVLVSSSRRLCAMPQKTYFSFPFGISCERCGVAHTPAKKKTYRAQVVPNDEIRADLLNFVRAKLATKVTFCTLFPVDFNVALSHIKPEIFSDFVAILILHDKFEHFAIPGNSVAQG